METAVWVLAVIAGVIILILTLLTSVSSLHKKYIERFWKEKKNDNKGN